MIAEAKDPQGFNPHEFLKVYINRRVRYNRGETLDHFCPGEVDLALAVIGHTQTARLVKMPKDEKVYYLMDYGSWINGGHEIGVISGKDMGVFQRG